METYRSDYMCKNCGEDVIRNGTYGKCFGCGSCGEVSEIGMIKQNPLEEKAQTSNEQISLTQIINSPEIQKAQRGFKKQVEPTPEQLNRHMTI
ncbi:MAG: hypothetical protein WC438_01865 [Candidatus Pacearchaeota archaeon]